MLPVIYRILTRYAAYVTIPLAAFIVIIGYTSENYFSDKYTPYQQRILTRYAPYVTLPFAAFVGVVGYTLENYFSDKYTPYQESISKQRRERLLECSNSTTNSLKDKIFVPNSIFERNLSPSLQEPEEKK